MASTWFVFSQGPWSRVPLGRVVWLFDGGDGLVRLLCIRKRCVAVGVDIEAGQ